MHGSSGHHDGQVACGAPPAAVTVWIAAADAALAERGRSLAAALDLPCAGPAGGIPPEAAGGLLLAVTADGLELREADAPNARGVHADFAAIEVRTGTGNLSRKQPIARAVGRESSTVLDATAGFGSDAVLLGLMGYRVTAVERAGPLAVLLRDALDRANANEAFRQALGDRVQVIHGDARAVLAGDPAIPRPDAVSIDPMFPAKRKASALPKKRLQLARRLVGDDPDAPDLLRVARERVRRVAVKRPSHAPPLDGAKPSFSIRTKLVRYDVYVG